MSLFLSMVSSLQNIGGLFGLANAGETEKCLIFQKRLPFSGEASVKAWRWFQHSNPMKFHDFSLSSAWTPMVYNGDDDLGLIGVFWRPSQLPSLSNYSVGPLECFRLRAGYNWGNWLQLDSKLM